MKRAPSTLKSIVNGAWHRFEHAWQNHHLSHRGGYSIERMRAMDEFCQRSRIAHRWIIGLVIPLPAVISSILVECIPLQNPLDGWMANHGYWIRCFMAFWIVGFRFMIQIKEMVSTLNYTFRQIIFSLFGTSVSSTAVYMSVASCWVFPVPFGLVLMSPVFYTLLVFFLFVSIEKEVVPKLWPRLRSHVIIIVVQSSLCVVYPALGALYNRLPSSQKPIVTLALPIVKMILSNAIARAARENIESLPGVIVMSLEVFNALYVTKCMQNTGSHATFVAIAAFDIFESIMVFRDIRLQTKQLFVLIGLKSAQMLPQRVLELCSEPGV